MIKGFLLGLAAVAAGLSTLTFAATPAFADAVSWVGQGSGYFWPGITAAPAPQNVSFSGDGPLVDANNPSRSGMYYCWWSGTSSIPETLIAGAGSLQGQCESATTTFGMQTSYLRRGLDVEISGSVIGDLNGTFTAVCHLAPITAAPMTTAKAVCELVLE